MFNTRMDYQICEYMVYCRSRQLRKNNGVIRTDFSACVSIQIVVFSIYQKKRENSIMLCCSDAKPFSAIFGRCSVLI